jgi:hypothetical protein
MDRRGSPFVVVGGNDPPTMVLPGFVRFIIKDDTMDVGPLQPALIVCEKGHLEGQRRQSLGGEARILRSDSDQMPTACQLDSRNEWVASAKDIQ